MQILKISKNASKNEPNPTIIGVDTTEIWSSDRSIDRTPTRPLNFLALVYDARAALKGLAAEAHVLEHEEMARHALLTELDLI